jgi:SWI/SNF-related matrix-associated actin-dependent regulator of chromatin subfamily A protein 2/4
VYKSLFADDLQTDDLEEGEIALSGDSPMDLQQSGSWNHERDDGEDEQVLQPKIKRKRSIRSRPRPNAEKQEDRSGVDGTFPQRGARLVFPGDGDYDSQLKSEQDSHTSMDPTSRQKDAVHPIVKQKRNMPSRKASPTTSRVGKSTHLSGSGRVGDSKMSDSMQRKVSIKPICLCPYDGLLW